MTTKLKTLKQPDIEKLIQQTQKRLDYLNKETEINEHNAWIKVGFAEGFLTSLIKQLKGEWPIL